MGEETTARGAAGDETAVPKNQADELKTEASIYVIKRTRQGDDGEVVTFDVGLNERTYLVDGTRAAALERIGDILDQMD